MRISDWSSDVCSSDLQPFFRRLGLALRLQFGLGSEHRMLDAELAEVGADHVHHRRDRDRAEGDEPFAFGRADIFVAIFGSERLADGLQIVAGIERSEEHTSELQSLMRISYAVFCLKKKNISNKK